LAYAKFAFRQNIWAYLLDRATAVSIRDGRPITAGSQVIETHDVSPDGRWIAYDCNTSGNADLYRMPLEGGAPVPLTNSPQDEWMPQWSPDGREIAFFGPRSPGEKAAIWVMPAQGGVAVRLTGDSGYSTVPRWSPDGLHIAYYPDLRPNLSAWVVSRDQTGGQWHSALPLSDSACFPEAWAPDGSGVLCTRQTGQGDIAVVSLSGRAVWHRTLSADRLTSNGTLAYSRDGKVVYFSASHQDGRRGIWAIPVRGGPPRLVVAYDDPSLVNVGGFFSVGRDRLYLTVAEYESDIWVAKLQY
jgi:Tol biopolymer transport system component